MTKPEEVTAKRCFVSVNMFLAMAFPRPVAAYKAIAYEAKLDKFMRLFMVGHRAVENMLPSTINSNPVYVNKLALRQ